MTGEAFEYPSLRWCGCGRRDCDWLTGTCPREPRGRLERRTTDGGSRDFLGGRPVHCGDALERLVGEVERGRGRWTPVRYEVDHRRGEAGATVQVPIYVDEKGEHDVAPGDVFRWPWPGERT